jgi:hypothetical protein
MRVFSRIGLTLLAVALFAQPAFSQPSQANCPLTLVASNPPASSFGFSPKGVFRTGNRVYVLRGQFLTTYTVTDLGDMQIAREDFINKLANRTNIGATAFGNNTLYVASEAGLETVNLANVTAGGPAVPDPIRVSGTNYHRLAISGSGNVLAALYPATEMPCPPSTVCPTFVDLWNVTNPAAPVRVASISSTTSVVGGFNDVAFNYNNLVVTGTAGTVVYDVSNLSLPRIIGTNATPGTFLVSNGTNLLAVGNDTQILTFSVTNPFSFLIPMTLHSLATLQVGRANRIVFHPQAYIDDTNNRLITMVDEMDPNRLGSARTIAFDVFDYTVPMLEGRDPRVYESVSWLEGDELKYNPVAVGPLVYVVGETTGLQTYGACGQMAGAIELSNATTLPCGGAEIHGWITGAQKINSVELFLDNASLGFATIGGPQRIDIPSTTPVFTWRIGTVLDATSRGNHILRAVGTDANNNRRQFTSMNVFFPGAGQNCANRRRSTSH